MNKKLTLNIEDSLITFAHNYSKKTISDEDYSILATLGDDNTLTNALAALTKRKIILKNPSKIGEYRLQQKGFAIWIKLFGDRKEKHSS